MLVASALLTPQVGAQTPTAPRKLKGKQVAVLIGVENYQNVTPLKFVGNDVNRLGETLKAQGGFDEVVLFTDSAADRADWPRRAVLTARLPDLLSGCSQDDTLIVYFSGHGFRDKDGTMYLAPLDIDPANLTATGIAVGWFREQIARCQAGLKLLVLDACHAGSEKGGSVTNIRTPDLNLFAELDGVITLASSTADQPSQMWPEKQQSLFSYWLNQALKGHADVDGDGTVNIDELNAYLHDNVTETAAARFSSAQTPVRKIGLKIPGQPVVEYLKPQSLKQVLADMAEQLADVIADRRLGNIGVLEFTNETISGDQLGASYGLLGRRCADELEERLATRARNRFEVVGRETLQQALQSTRFSLADLGSGERLKDLSSRAGGVRVLAKGQLYGRLGALLNLRCKLIDTQTSRTLAAVGGVAWLSPQEWAMLAQSVALEPADYRPETPTGDEPSRPNEHAVIDRMDALAKGPHPLQNPKSRFRVRLMVNATERKGEFRGNDYFVPLRKGEEFEIWVENRTGNLVCMRLLVDGLNTLPEKDQPGGRGLITEILGKPIADLGTARHYIIDPQNPADVLRDGRNVVAMRGFVTRTGVDGEVARFTVVDADHSLAARKNFTGQLGLITVGFYAPAGIARSAIGVTDGKTIAQNLKERRGVPAGKMLEIIHLRYYDPDAPEAAY